MLDQAELLVAQYGIGVGAFEFRNWLGRHGVICYAPWDPPPGGL